MSFLKKLEQARKSTTDTSKPLAEARNPPQVQKTSELKPSYLKKQKDPLSYYRGKPIPKTQKSVLYSQSDNKFFEQFKSETESSAKTSLSCASASLFLSMIAVLLLVLIDRTEGYIGPPPQNGYVTQNKVMRCNFGYKKTESNTCQLKKEYIEQAELLSKDLINELKFKYGDSQCYGNQSINTINFESILKADPVDKASQIINKQMRQFLYNTTNQKLYNFSLQQMSGTIIIRPQQKLYSLRCRLEMVIKSPRVRIAGIVMVGLLLVIIWKIRSSLKFNHANRVYQHLKEKVKKNDEIILRLQSEELQDLFGDVSNLWPTIESIRIQQRKIIKLEDTSKGEMWALA